MVHQERRLSKREKRIARQNGDTVDKPTFKSPNFNLNRINPMTDNQRLMWRAFEEGKHIMAHGMAGTGKTFLSMYLALDDIMSGTSEQNKIFIVRSVVPTRDMGFLPGNQKEKMKVYESPYYSICTELFDRSDAYDILKQKNVIEFMSTSFVRGVTMNNAYIIVDEINKMTFHELDSIITRIGKNCRIIFCGDYRQSDLTKDQERNGLRDFIKIVDLMQDFAYIDFLASDIVRSKLVKDYIITREKLGLTA